MRKYILLSGLLFWGVILYGQIPFVCDGDLFLSLEIVGSTGLYQVEVEPATGTVFLSGLSPSNNSGNIIDAMGYRIVDNLIYGVNPGTGQIFSIGSDGVAYQVGSFQNTPQYSYYAGDVTPDGSELIVLGAGGNPNISQELATISFLNFSVSKQTMTLASGAASDVNCADIAFDPFTGILYGYDSRDRRLITIDPTTGIINDTFPASQGANVLGAMYFDVFGQLRGYGTPSGGSTQNIFFEIDKGTGILTPFNAGPPSSTSNTNDGASCPYTIEIQHWVNPSSSKSCDTILYYVKVANYSGGSQSGLDIVTDLPNGLTIDQIVYNPYGGVIVSGPGTDRLEVQNATVDIGQGQDSLVFTVVTEPLTLGVFASQAKLLGLPPAFGDSAFSDDPFTPPFLDSTRLRIAADTIILPTQTLEFCQGDTLTLTTSDPDALLFEWSDGSTGSSLTVTQPGTYWVNAIECDITVDTFKIIELPLPVVDAGADQSICFGETANLLVSGTLSYTWSQLGSPTIISTSPNPILAPGDTTTYVVIGTDVNGCQNTDTIQIGVKPLSIMDAGNDTTICLYESVVLGNSSNPPGNYVWTPDTNLVSMGSSPLFTPSSAGNFPITLSLTDTFGCTQTDVVNVTVNDFQLTINTTDIDCFGDDNGVARLVGSGISPYIYTLKAGGNDIQSGTQTNFPISIDSLAPGSYSVVVMDGNGCIDSLNFNIIQPSAPPRSPNTKCAKYRLFWKRQWSIDRSRSWWDTSLYIFHHWRFFLSGKPCLQWARSYSVHLSGTGWQWMHCNNHRYDYFTYRLVWLPRGQRCEMLWP
ncbi:MAG: hypothetical protein AAFO96_09815 [Bacteroidota bacterium]